MPITSYLIALGSNRRGRHGAPAAELAAALARLDGEARVVRLSRPLATAPIGPARRRFVNRVALVDSADDPPALLARLKAIERGAGRRRGRRWGDRVIDLDIVLWSGGAWAGPGLTVPHPGFRERLFVLDPLVEIAADWRDPVTGLSVRQLRHRLTARRPLPRSRSVWVRSSVGRASDF